MLKILHKSAVFATKLPAFGLALQLLDRRIVNTSDILAVVTYHRIDYASRTPHLYPGLISTHPEGFVDQLDLLAEIGNVVSMQQVLKAIRGESELPTRSVLITFDDATLDFQEFALPELRSRNLPATLFVPTGFVEQRDFRFWWDRLHQCIWYSPNSILETKFGRFRISSYNERITAYRKLRDVIKTSSHQIAMEFVESLCQQEGISSTSSNVMNWEQLRQLPKQGVTLAPHTQSHPLLTRISRKEARNEIVASRDDLQREIGNVLPVFAYPGGAHNPFLVETLRQEGIELAFTVERGVNDLGNADLLRLKRINVGQRTTKSILQAQLLAGWWRNSSTTVSKSKTV